MYLSFLNAMRLVLTIVVMMFLITACNENTPSLGNEPAQKTTDADRRELSQSVEMNTSMPAHIYAFSMLAPGKNSTPIIYARVILEGSNQACPTLTASDNSTLAMSVRPLNPTAQVIDESKFKVTVCEAVMAQGIAYSNNTYGITIDAVSLVPQMIQIYGDSGCSSCTGTNPSPDFQSLAQLGAKKENDLILHMGDFNYRGTSGAIQGNTWAYDAGDGAGGELCELDSTYNSQNSLNSPRKDEWLNWQYDFFEAAKELLPTAPWVFARGNHELCSRAGPGWFYFLGPGSSLKGAGRAQMQCPDQGDFTNPPATAKAHIAMIEPYQLTFTDFELWVMDSANACDAYGVNELTAQYTQQYEELAAKTSNTNTWVMSHRPLWGYQSPHDASSLSQMLQVALKNTQAKVLPGFVSLLVAGHMHTYESLSFLTNSNRPPQIVVGNSGVKLAKHPKPHYFNNPVYVDGEQATGNTLEEFGFLSIKRSSSGGWIGQMFGTSDQVILKCGSGNVQQGNTVCATVD